MPVLEALGQLCDEVDGQPIRDCLKRYAPSWLLQLPWLLDDADRQELQRRTTGSGKEHMLREIAQALEALTQERPLLLWLEDLHWADYSTLDLVSYLAQRRQPARLLVVATYRPVAIYDKDHPLRAIQQELQARRLCRMLSLPLLDSEAVAAYLVTRFPGISSGLAQMLYRHTDGNPLFMVNVVEQWIDQGLIKSSGQGWKWTEGVENLAIPENLRLLIERQIDGLELVDKKILEAAAVAGAEFSAALVATVLQEDNEFIEERCVSLIRRRQFLRPLTQERWPDGTQASCYAFVHALYRQAFYEELTTTRRRGLHHHVGQCLERVYGSESKGIAAQLALHFEQAGEFSKAIQYLEQAADNALQRHAHQEAIAHFHKAIAILEAVADIPQREERELGLQLALGISLGAIHGHGAQSAEQAHNRAYALCRQLEKGPQLFRAVLGLWSFYLLQGNLTTARELAEQLQIQAQQNREDSTLMLRACQPMVSTLTHQGEIIAADEYINQCLALYDPQRHGCHATVYGYDEGVFAYSYAAWVLWLLGYPAQAQKKHQQALELGKSLGYPVNRAIVLTLGAEFQQMQGNTTAVGELAQAALELSSEQGFMQWLGLSSIMQGWSQALRGQTEAGITQLRQGIDGWRAIGAGLDLSYYHALLAEAYIVAEQSEAGLQTIAEALAVVEHNGERYYEAELYRLKGVLILQSDPGREQEAEDCFHQAIAVACRQSAKSWELRANLDLARLWQKQERNSQAHQQLTKIYGWFTEGFATPNLCAARKLLEQLN